MRLSLLVLTPGKWEGKSVPVTVSPFLIGRDPQCHLRPASQAISKLHCAVIVRDGSRGGESSSAAGVRPARAVVTSAAIAG